jgi:tetratricopeptide (TPR) repeat protein
MIDKGVHTMAAYNDRALSYKMRGDYDNAIADFSHALDISRDWITYEWRSQCYFAKGDYFSAIADFFRSVANGKRWI